MHDTGTVLGGDIITRYDAEGVRRTVNNRVGLFDIIHRFDPREELLVLQTDKVRSLTSPNDFRLEHIAVLIHPAEFFAVRIQTRLGENNTLSGRSLHLDIINLRAHAEGGIGRQRPRGCGPGDDITPVLQLEQRRAGRVFHIAVATRLVQLMARQACSRHRRIRLNGVALVHIALLVQLFEQVPQRFDIFVVVGDVGVLQIHPIAHLLGQIGPLLGVFHHLAAAGGIVFIDDNLLSDILFLDA